MRILKWLLRRDVGGDPGPTPYLRRLPLQDPAEREEEAEVAAAQVRALHGHAGMQPGLGRRVAAVVEAARRRRPKELAEALAGLSLVGALSLRAQLLERRALDRGGIAAMARALLETTGDPQELAAALVLLSLAPAQEDRPALVQAAISPRLAPAAAAAALPLGDVEAMLQLVEAARGVGRALVVEELLRGRTTEELQAPSPAQEGRLVRLVGEIEDSLDRAWAAAPLLEVVDAPALLGDDPTLAGPLARCLEANARGGWRGGPGPGLGRLRGSTQVAEALLAGPYDEAAQRVAAQAVMDAHPAPYGKVMELAQQRLA